MTPYRKIIRAADRRKSLTLTPEDAAIVAKNPAIIEAAAAEAQVLCKRNRHHKQRNGKCACSMT